MATEYDDHNSAMVMHMMIIDIVMNDNDKSVIHNVDLVCD